ncbi:hypothetical protein C366_02685 [Cryptococcus neoformans Tu401-1]|nr:hypothetical protein C356_02556 [Cryptococcus neoformans var. grubii c45]OXB37696.1 hypothetical protein J007_02541 [Cryptococcus neoformans var. grubii]OXC61986.1 hypothetical protein C358_02601 [Cryptococcus neoformans var. grubii MW-RSA852]OXG18580.1 hypothetical protein C366_02685 [Cryptococcus neoformans var. grubii Tu401-1]
MLLRYSARPLQWAGAVVTLYYRSSRQSSCQRSRRQRRE